MPEGLEVPGRDLHQRTVLHAESLHPLRTEVAEHGGDPDGVPGDALVKVRIRRHEDAVRRPGPDHLGMHRLATGNARLLAQVDEPITIAAGFQLFGELYHTHRDCRIIEAQRLGGEHQELELYAGALMRRGGDHADASLPSPADQDLALDQQGDGLLDRRQADLMLLGQVSSRRQQPLPTLLTDLNLDRIC